MAISTLLQGGSPYARNIVRADDWSSAQPRMVLKNLGSGGGVVIMPMPVSISSNTGIEWEQADMGLLGQAELVAKDQWSTLAGKGDMGKALGSYAVEGVGKGLVGGAKDAITNVGMIMGNETMQDFINNRAGKMLHPMSEMTFRGVGFRAFQFQYKIAPLDADHQERIAMAIQALQVGSLPRVDGAGGGGNFKYFSYPAAWSVRFKPSEDYLPSLLNSVITGIQVDYSSAGRSAFHEDNGPVEVSISLTLTETTIFTAEHAEGGYYG